MAKRDPQTTSIINRSMVLALIHRNPLISRAQIADMIGLDRSTITHIINFLLKQELVREVKKGKASSRGGRCPVQLQVRYDKKYIISIDVGTKQIDGVITDLLGREAYRCKIGLSRGEPLVDKLKDILDIMEQKKKLFQEAVLIGISSPGVIDSINNVLLLNVFHGWKDIAVADELNEKYGKPVFIENDANAAAMGELQEFKADGINSLMYFFVREAPVVSQYLLGVGGGIIFKGKLWHGSHFYSGEVSNAVNVSIENVLQRHWSKDTIFPGGKLAISFSEIIEKEKAGDEIAVSVLDDIARAVGLMLSEYANLMDTQGVMIYVNTTHKTAHFLEKIEESFLHNNKLVGNAPVQFLFPQKGRKAMAAGLIALAQEKLFIYDGTHASLLFK
jgi:predicted NBD/HSP70 family sugar kinase